MSKQRSHGSGSLYKLNGRGAWRIAYYGADGRRRTHSTRTTDRATAERILAKHVGDAALRREGVIDAKADRFAEHDRRPLSAHLAEWLAGLAAKGVSVQQRNQLATRCRAILDATKAERIRELSASAVQGALGELRERGLSALTIRHYLRAVKQFSRWLHRDGRARDDALAHLSAPGGDAEARYVRRALDADELRRLVEAAAGSRLRFRGLSGDDRAMLYRVAAGTGFRARELASLTPRDFDLDADPPAIILSASSSKRRKADRQPIRRDLADMLKPWLAGRPADKSAWPGRWFEKGARMIRHDLRRARAAWIRETPSRSERRERRDSAFLAVKDAAGRLVDFHALRVSFITALVKGGASVKSAQTLARHSDPKLTLNTYTRLGVHDLAGALELLPDVAPAERQTAVALANGTDGKPTQNDKRDHQQLAQQLGRETPRRFALACEMPAAKPETSDARKSIQITDSRDAMQQVASEVNNAPGRIRTCDLRLRKPLLYPAELRAQDSRVMPSGGRANPKSRPVTPADEAIRGPVVREAAGPAASAFETNQAPRGRISRFPCTSCPPGHPGNDGSHARSHGQGTRAPLR